MLRLSALWILSDETFYDGWQYGIWNEMFSLWCDDDESDDFLSKVLFDWIQFDVIEAFVWGMVWNFIEETCMLSADDDW